MLDSSQASGYKYPNRENLILRTTSEAFLSTFTVADSRYTLFRPPGLFSVDMGTACHFFGSAPESALAGTASLRILNPVSWRRLLGPASCWAACRVGSAYRAIWARLVVDCGSLALAPEASLPLRQTDRDTRIRLHGRPLSGNQ